MSDTPYRKAANYKSCPSHCCPVHGCKYGYGVWATGICPVVSGAVKPTYVFNNGCERCKADRFKADELRGSGVVDFGGYDALASAVWAWEAFNEAKTPLLQAHYLIEVANAMSDLASWHPNYNSETGEIDE